jgi:membrane protease YdiL (CAAX protease family)
MEEARPGFRAGVAIRNAAEIGVILLYLVYAPAGLEWLVIHSGLKVDNFVQVAGISGLSIVMFLIAAGMVRLGGQRLSDVGLARPKSVVQSAVIGAAAAALVFAVVEVLNRIGVMHRDLSEVASLKNNLPVLIAWVAMVVLVSGFVEEFVYRGFVMDRISKIFGGSRGAWAAAFIGQAVIFGLAHAYGSLQLELFAGVFALLYAGLYLWQGNLWAAIAAHGLYDASRVIFAYILLSAH